MRAIWKGAVSFGLVSVPVKLYSATESHDVSFRQVHAKDGGRIKYQRVCSIDGEEVAYADIAKGYETEDGEMVILSDDDMADLPSTSSREIAVEKFVPSDQIDPMLFEKSYYLEPESTGAKPYALLRQALIDADRMAVVTVALRQRTTIAVLRVRDDVIVLQTMMWPDEIRKPDFNVETGEVKDAEVKMANMLVETLAGDFDASEFEDDYAEAVAALVKAKIEGGEVKRTARVDEVLRRGGRPAGRAAALGGRRQDRPRRGQGRREGPGKGSVQAEEEERQGGQEAGEEGCEEGQLGATMAMTHSPGDPCWIELFTPDVHQAREFYGELFGWTSHASGEEYGGYVVFERDGEPIAGCMKNDGSMGPSMWSVYLASADAAATAEKAKEHGGQVVAGPMQVGEMGHMAFLVDPAGAGVGVWQPLENKGISARGDNGAPAWFETLSKDYDAAVPFYRDVFGWDIHTMSDTDEFRYATLGEGDEAKAGIMDATAFLGDQPSRWQFYVEVARHRRQRPARHRRGRHRGRARPRTRRTAGSR